MTVIEHLAKWGSEALFEHSKSGARRFGLLAACSMLWCELQHFSLMLGVGF